MATADEDATNLARDLAQLTCSSQADTSPGSPNLVELETSLTPTQRAIRSLLEVPLPREQALTSAIQTLKTMAKENSTRQSRRTCCFDVAGMLESSPSWCAQGVRTCQRCAAGNWVLQAWRDNKPSNVVANLVVRYLGVTNCTSDDQRSEHPPTLPYELIQLIVDYVIDDMSKTRDGTTLAALMHVSSWVRYLAVRKFTFPDKYDEENSIEVEHISPALAALAEEIRAHLPTSIAPKCRKDPWPLADFSVLRHGNEPKACSVRDAVVFGGEDPTRYARMKVSFESSSTCEAWFDCLGCSKDDGSFGGRVSLEQSYSNPADLRHVFEHMLAEARRLLKSQRRVDAFPPQPMNPHHRALCNGSLSDLVWSYDVYVCLELWTSPEESHLSASRTWCYNHV